MLSDCEIKTAIKNKEIKIDPFEEDCLAGSSYELRIGDRVYFPGTGRRVNLSEQHNETSIKPLAMAWIQSYESIFTSAHIAGIFVSKVIPSLTYAQISTPLDPNWGSPSEGRNLIFPVTNFSSRTQTLKYKEKICKVMFYRLSKPAEKMAKRQTDFWDITGADEKKNTFASRLINHSKNWTLNLIIPLAIGLGVSYSSAYFASSYFNIPFNETVLGVVSASSIGLAGLIYGVMKGTGISKL